MYFQTFQASEPCTHASFAGPKSGWEVSGRKKHSGLRFPPHRGKVNVEGHIKLCLEVRHKLTIKQGLSSIYNAWNSMLTASDQWIVPQKLNFRSYMITKSEAKNVRFNVHFVCVCSIKMPKKKKYSQSDCTQPATATLQTSIFFLNQNQRPWDSGTLVAIYKSYPYIQLSCGRLRTIQTMGYERE